MLPQDLGIGRLFESVRDAVIVAEAGTGRIVLWNQAATEIFGYSPSEALELRVEALVPERFKARHLAGMSRYREAGHGPYIDSREVLDLPAVRKTGEEISVEFTLSPVEPDPEAPGTGERFVLAIMRDVTERKRAEEEIGRLNEGLERRVAERAAELEAAMARLQSSERMLRESEERYRLLVESAEDYAIFAVDPEGRVTSWNAGAERIFGYQEEEIVGEHGSLVFTPEDRRRGAAEEVLRRARDEGRAEDERWHVRKDGTRFWASGFVRPVRDEEGNLRGFTKVARDITERKQAEDERERLLGDSERRAAELDAVIGSVPDALYVGGEGGISMCNRAALDMLGFENVEELNQQIHLLGARLQNRFAETGERILPEEEPFAQALAGETVVQEVITRNLKTGRDVIVRCAAAPVRQEGEIVGAVAVNTDVTERKRAEEQARFLADLDRALQPLTEPDEVTAAAARMLGGHLGADRCAYAEVEADEDHFRITGDYTSGVPSIVGRFAMSQFGSEALRLMRAGEPYVVEDAEADERVAAEDLTAYRQTQIRAVVSVPLYKAGRFVAGMAVHQKTPRHWSCEEVELVATVANKCWESIERARAEKTLRRSEEHFRTLADNISQLVWMADETGWIFWYNKRWFDYTGTTLEEMQGWGWMKVHHPEHVDRVVERAQRAWGAGEPWEETFPLRAKTGTYRWFLTRVRPIRDEAGRIVRWFGTNTDVTEQREAEEALRESEERYRAVIEQSAEGIYLVDVGTMRVMEANPAFRELLGYDAPEELVGRDVYELIALPAEVVDEAVRLTVEAGRRVVGERRYRRKDGTLVDVEVGASLISYGGTRVICAVVRDMTERKRAEEALREVREAERNRMARDLHDGPLQDLTYASAEAQLARMLSEDEELDNRLEQVVSTLKRGMQGLREAVYDLRLQEERDRPLSESLESLLEMNRQMNPDSNIRLNLEGGVPSSSVGERGVELMRVLQEALSNVRRHSGAENVLVSLRTEGDDLVAEVQDDGRGFDPNATQAGIGQKSMRERTAALGGQLEIESKPGEGTRMRVRVPLGVTNGVRGKRG